MKKLFYILILTIFMVVSGGCEYSSSQPTVDEVVIDRYPSKLIYESGDSIDLTGLLINAYYSDESVVEVTDYACSLNVVDEVGFFDVFITCEIKNKEYEVKFEIEVKARTPRVDKVEITQMPFKLEYNFLDRLDLTGLEVTVHYDDDTSIVTENYTLSVDILSVVGAVEVIITVDLGTKYQVSFNIFVNEVPMKTLSYVSSLGTYQLNDESGILNNTHYQLQTKHTLTGVKDGGFRNTNEIVCYNNSNITSRNQFGFEIAVNENGIVVDKATLVDLPANGFILSGHSAGGNTLANRISLGDYVTYDSELLTVVIYNQVAFSTMYKNKVYINELSDVINLAYDNFLPLDYAKVKDDFYELVEYYNETVTSLTNNNNLNMTEINNTFECMLFDIRTACITYQGVENRAFWHYPLTLESYGYSEKNKDGVTKLLDYLVATGFNMVMINTNIGGFSIYKSDYLPRNGVISSGYDYGEYGNDYLMCFIEEAHKRGIKVVAWTQTLMCGDGYLPNHINRDWVLRDYQGNIVSGVYFYDILNDDVQDFLVNVYQELATKYNLDGLEYDIIRYPVSRLYEHDNSGVIEAANITDSGYTEAGMAKFMEKYQLTGDLKQLILESADIRKKFHAFKVEELTRLVGRLSTAIRAARPGIKISAAVISNAPSTKRVYMQDWVDWSVKGYVDYLDPMIYTSSDSGSLSTLLQTLASVEGTGVLVNSGLSPIIENGTHHQTINQINLTHQTNASGFVIFSSRHFFNNTNFIKALEKQKNPISLTTYDDQNKIALHFITNMLNEIENFYSVADLNSDFSTIKNILSSIDDRASFNQKYTLLQTELAKITNDKILDNLVSSLTRVRQFITN